MYRLSSATNDLFVFTKRPISSVKIGMLFESAKFPFVLKRPEFPCQLIDQLLIRISGRVVPDIPLIAS
jgi:hypothetical protein